MENENFEKIENRLRTFAHITPNLHWRTGLRSILLTVAAARKKPASSFALVMKLAGAGTFISVFLVSGTIIYAQNSLPGDFLYPIKRGYENFRLTLAGKEGKFDEQQRLADKRINELKKVVLQQNENSSDFAIKEVQSSVNQIKARVSTIRKEYQSLKLSGQDTTSVQRTLESIVPVLEENQSNLAEVADALPKPKQLQVEAISDTLRNLQQQIKEDLNPIPEGETIKDTTQGVTNQPKEPVTSTQQVNP